MMLGFSPALFALLYLGGEPPLVDLDGLVAALTPSNKPAWRRKSTPNGSRNGSQEKSPGPVRIPATATDWNFKTSKERAMGLEPTTSSLGSMICYPLAS